MRIILLGCPGAGKGTQSKMLSLKYSLEHISTGDIFRSEIEKKSVLGLKAAEYVNNGSLVPDDLVVRMVGSRLDSSSGNWLLDGFPRTLDQAKELDKYLATNEQSIDMVVNLVMDKEEVIERLTSRRTCSACGEVFNLMSRPSQIEGKCDRCGEKLIQREDDSEETVTKRLEVYAQQTAPLVSYYRENSRFNELNGSGTFQDIARGLYALLDQLVPTGKVN